MEEKKQRALSALLEYAGGYKILTYLSLILSALSSVLSLMPFVFLWRIIREVLEVQPVCRPRRACLCRRAGLFSRQRVPYGRQYEKGADAPHRPPPHRLCG